MNVIQDRPRVDMIGRAAAFVSLLPWECIEVWNKINLF